LLSQVFTMSFTVAFIWLLQSLILANTGFWGASAQAGETACATVSEALSYCESVTPGFTTLPASEQAPCLCYSSTVWDPNFFDGYVFTCAEFWSTAKPADYSAIAALESFCSIVGNVLGEPASATATVTEGPTTPSSQAGSSSATLLPVSSSSTPSGSQPVLAGGAIAGIVVGVTVCILVAFGSWLLYRYKSRRPDPVDPLPPVISMSPYPGPDSEIYTPSQIPHEPLRPSDSVSHFGGSTRLRIPIFQLHPVLPLVRCPHCLSRVNLGQYRHISIQICRRAVNMAGLETLKSKESYLVTKARRHSIYHRYQR